MVEKNMKKYSYKHDIFYWLECASHDFTLISLIRMKNPWMICGWFNHFENPNGVNGILPSLVRLQLHSPKLFPCAALLQGTGPRTSNLCNTLRFGSKQANKLTLHSGLCWLLSHTHCRSLLSFDSNRQGHCQHGPCHHDQSTLSTY